MDEPVRGGTAHYRARGLEWLLGRLMAVPGPAESAGAANAWSAA